MNTKPILLSLALGASAASAQVFTSDFSGTQPWNFDSLTDPQTQVGGTGQFEYTGAATNGVSYVEDAFTLAPTFTAETGTLVISGSLDISGIEFGTGDFNKRNFLTIMADSGNKGKFDGGGAILNLGLGGWNNPGEFSLGQDLTVRFWGGGVGQIGNFIPTGVVDFETTLIVSGDDATGWNLDATTTISGGATGSTNSTYSRTDAGFDGLQSISGIQVGFDGTTSVSSNFTAADTFIIDDVSVSVIPEPSTYAMLFGLLTLGVAGLRRRR